MNDIAKIEPNQNPVIQQTQPAIMISMIERVVMNPEIPMDRLLAMIELKERYEDRESEKAYKDNMAIAKKAFKPLVKTRDGHNSKYADLNDLSNAVDDALSDHGFTYDFEMDQDDEISVTCVVSHKQGHSKRNKLKAAPDKTGSKNAIQSLGSTITYLQRYTLSAALGISAGTDTDGVINDKELISADQMQDVLALIEKSGSDTARFCKYMQINSIKEMPLVKLGKAEKTLKAKLDGDNG